MFVCLFIYFVVSIELDKKPKHIFVTVPPYADKNDPPEEFDENIYSDQDIFDLEKREMGRLCFYDSVSNKLFRIKSKKDLVENQVYIINSPSLFGTVLDIQRLLIDSKTLEREATLALKNFLGENAHEYYNVVTTNKTDSKTEKEYDGVVVHVGESIEVYIIECAYSPMIDKVKKLLDKIETAKSSLPSLLDFSPTSKFIPVLGGRFFTEEVDMLCKMNRIWQIKPSGSGYSIHHNFSTVD